VVKVWVAVCSDNVTGVASSQAKADELYGCGHGEDSFCCWAEEVEVDAVRKSVPRAPRHRPPVIQEALPL
jgi:hypothetical protein